MYLVVKWWVDATHRPILVLSVLRISMASVVSEVLNEGIEETCPAMCMGMACRFHGEDPDE